MWHYSILIRANIFNIISSNESGYYSYLQNRDEDNVYQRTGHSVEKLKIIIQKMYSHYVLQTFTHLVLMIFKIKSR